MSEEVNPLPTSPSYQVSQLGYFLDFHLWEDAIRLLEFQVNSKNKHFNTLSMSYYRKVKKRLKSFKKKNYFEQKVASNLFYGLQEEFRVHSYGIPKSNGLGIRNYKLLTPSLRTLHYSIGIYLVVLSNDFLQSYHKSNKHIRSYYGGKLIAETVDGRTGLKASLKSDDIYFRSHYEQFAREARQEAREKADQKVIIRLDIQNFFDELSLSILMNLLNESIKSSDQKRLNFDEATQEQIVAFYRFVAQGRNGVPQMDNNIISAFIAHLYLSFGDLLIDSALREYGFLEEYKILRYVDDFAISLTFDGIVREEEYDHLSEMVAQQITEILYNELSLKLNFKSKLFRLSRKEDREKYIMSIKQTSFGDFVTTRYEVPNNNPEDDDEDSKSLQTKVDEMLDIAENLKNSSLRRSFNRLEDEVLEKLKNVYNPDIENLLKKRENKERVVKIFYKNFNFDLIHVAPIPFLIIISIDWRTKKKLREFLEKKLKPNLKESDTILRYLLQNGINEPEHKKLLKTLEKSQSLGSVVKRFGQAHKETRAVHKEPGYFMVNDVRTRTLWTEHYIVSQIQARRFSEMAGEYSVALNHLLNEIHAVCCWKDPGCTSMKSYSAKHVTDFLMGRGIEHGIVLRIRNLFDRRNNTPVSHPGYGSLASWAVPKSEYQEFYEHVGRCLDRLL